MSFFLRFLAVAYLVGAIVHILDLFGLRLDFSSMTMIWKLWTIYLIVGDATAAFGLWKTRIWGEFTFLIVAMSQLIAYMGFKEVFGEQTFLVGFHAVTVAVYGWLKFATLSKSCV